MQKPALTRLTAALMCAAAVGCAVCLYAALTFDYDIRLHHFAVGSPAAAAATALCLCGLALALAQGAAAMFTHSRALPAEAGTAAVFSASLTGFLMLAGFILGFMRYTDLSGGWLERIRLALMALSAFYLLAVVPRRGKAELSPLKALISLAPILYAFLSVMSVYFDTSMGMNAPLKSYLLMMYLSMALFFTAEARLTLGRAHTAGYTLLAGICTVLCGAVGAATLAVSLYDTQGFGFPLVECAAALSVAVFAAIRLFSMREATEEEADEHAKVNENA